MSAQGYDTWILEVRGAGLSTHGTEANGGCLNFSGKDLLCVNLMTIVASDKLM